MMEFKYKSDTLETIVKLSEHSTLSEALAAFESFLHAATYCFDGHLELVEEENLENRA